jgi:voltage-gated potassium channel
MALAPRARERLAVALTAAVGVLSLVTGVVNLGPAMWATPLARHVPEVVQTAVALTGAFTGFAVLVTAWGLKRRLSAAWWSAVVLLPVTALQAVAQSSLLSLPLFVLSMAALPTMFASRQGFDRDVSFSQAQWSGIGALAAVLVYGTVGSFLLREEFRGLETPLDALYYTVVTASTVGYGDVTATSPLGRAFALSVVGLGIAGFGLAAAALLVPALENQIVHASDA